MLEGYDFIGTAVPWQMLISLRNRFYCETWVELGAGYGHQSAIALEHFRNVHAVELMPPVYNSQVPQLRFSTTAHRYVGHSTDKLPAILQAVHDQTVLWYIDSHWPGTGLQPNVECPLLDELRILRDAGRIGRDVLVVDNAGMFTQPPRPPHDPAKWPTIQQIAEQLDWCEVVADVIYRAPEQILCHYGSKP